MTDKNLVVSDNNLDELKTKLELLAKMYSDDIISEEEYEDLKQVLIDSFKKSFK